jgi:type IV pilus assembly protein PilO
MSLIEDLQRLDANNIGNAPPVVKGLVISVICIVVLALGIYFDTTKQYSSLQLAQQKEQQLKKTFEEKQGKAANLDSYQSQMTDMEKIFGEMLRQLPSKTEVAALLVDVSQVGVASGLEFELFKPQSEIPIEFYAELPINLRVTGNYHDFGNFVSGVAALPRIVTIHDFSIFKRKDDPGLVMEATAKTYRYLDEEEIAREKAMKMKKKKK